MVLFPLYRRRGRRRYNSLRIYSTVAATVARIICVIYLSGLRLPAAETV